MAGAKLLIAAGLCLSLAIFAPVCQANNVSVVYGEPQYTISNDGVKTVYFTPDLCSRDTAASLPASDSLILALNLSSEATIMSFQVATVNQAESQLQEQIVVRVGDIQPEDGPSDNPLCSIATVNSSSIMTTFVCSEPLNGTYITVTKNDGGKMDICGFSATLSDDSDADGPILSADPVTVFALENDNSLQDQTVLSENKVFAEAPAAPPADDNVIVFGQSYIANANTGSLPIPSPVASPLQAANVFVTQSSGPAGSVTFFPAPALTLPAMNPSGSVAINSISTDAELISLGAVPVPAPVPAPGPSPALAPASVSPPVQPILTFASALPQLSAATPVPAPAPVLAPAPAPVVAPVSGAASALPVISFAGQQAAVPAPVPAPVAAPGLAPTPAPVAAPVPAAASALPVVSFAGQQAAVPAPAPVSAPVPAPVLAPAPTTAAPVPAPVPAPGPSTSIPVIPNVLVFSGNGAAPVPAPAPSPVLAPQVASVPVQTATTATAPVSFSRANLIATQPQSPPPPTDSNSSGSSQSTTKSGSGLSGGDKAGIAVGVIAGVALLAAATYFIMQRRR